MSFAAPAPKILENNSGEKGLPHVLLTHRRIHAPGPHNPLAKRRADPVGNSSKTRCPSVLFKTPPFLFLRPTKDLKSYYEYYPIGPALSKEKSTPERPMYVYYLTCMCGGGRDKHLTDICL